MSASSDRVISWAYNRVLARYRASGAEVPPFDQLVREVLKEISDEMDRRLRKAARHLQAAGELSAVIRKSPALRAVAPERRFTDLDLAALVAGSQAPPKAMNGHGPRGAGPPSWHPESHRETEDD